MTNSAHELTYLTTANAQELYAHFDDAAVLPYEEGLEILRLIGSELKVRNQKAIETSLAFIALMESAPLGTVHKAECWGGIATRFSLEVREVDRDSGMRKVHGLLENRNRIFRNGSWTEIERWNEKGRLPYDDYHSLYVVRAMN